MRQDTRRATRTIVHVIGSLAMIVMLGWIVALSTDVDTIKIISVGLVLILLVREFFHGAENVTQRWKFSASLKGVSGEFGDNE